MRRRHDDARPERVPRAPAAQKETGRPGTSAIESTPLPRSGRWRTSCAHQSGDRATSTRRRAQTSRSKRDQGDLEKSYRHLAYGWKRGSHENNGDENGPADTARPIVTIAAGRTRPSEVTTLSAFHLPVSAEHCGSDAVACSRLLGPAPARPIVWRNGF